MQGAENVEKLKNPLPTITEPKSMKAKRRQPQLWSHVSGQVCRLGIAVICVALVEDVTVMISERGEA